MRYLYRDTRSCRKNFAQEDRCFGCSVRSMTGNRRPQVNNDCHTVGVRSLENATHLGHLARIVEIYVRIPKVELQATNLSSRTERSVVERSAVFSSYFGRPDPSRRESI